MSMALVNRICPKCKNPNYMVFLGDFSERYKYKCMNCNRYFNDADFEEQFQPVLRSKNYVVVDMPIEQARTIIGLVEDTVNDGEFEMAWMDDQKEHLKNFLARCKDVR